MGGAVFESKNIFSRLNVGTAWMPDEFNYTDKLQFIGHKEARIQFKEAVPSVKAATTFLNSQVFNTNKPKAFVNWIFLDEQFKYYAEGTDQVGDNEIFKTHVLNGEPINKSGYLYVYVSNETPKIVVFFDNLQVTHIR